MVGKCPSCAATYGADDTRWLNGVGWTRCPSCLEVFEVASPNTLGELEPTMLAVAAEEDDNTPLVAPSYLARIAASAEDGRDDEGTALVSAPLSCEDEDARDTPRDIDGETVVRDAAPSSDPSTISLPIPAMDAETLPRPELDARPSSDAAPESVVDEAAVESAVDSMQALEEGEPPSFEDSLSLVEVIEPPPRPYHGISDGALRAAGRGSSPKIVKKQEPPPLPMVRPAAKLVGLDELREREREERADTVEAAIDALQRPADATSSSDDRPGTPAPAAAVSAPKIATPSAGSLQRPPTPSLSYLQKPTPTPGRASRPKIAIDDNPSRRPRASRPDRGSRHGGRKSGLRAFGVFAVAALLTAFMATTALVAVGYAYRTAVGQPAPFAADPPAAKAAIAPSTLVAASADGTCGATATMQGKQVSVGVQIINLDEEEAARAHAAAAPPTSELH